MHRLPRVIALALLLAVTLVPTSAFASSPPATTPGVLSAAWEPLARLWEWLSGQVDLQRLVPAPRAGRRPAPKAAARPAGTLSPAVRTDDGAGADPYGGSPAHTDEGAEADPYGA